MSRAVASALVLCACAQASMMPDACSGCLTAAGVCMGGSTATACGLNGVSCMTCANGAACASGRCVATDAGVAGLEAWQTELLSAHNAARAAAMPVPSPALPALTWSAAAADVATQWAAQCTFEHNAGRGNLGENLFASTGAPTPQRVVDSWVSEASMYDYAGNTCSAGQLQCGHYTQVVWRATTSVGCASRRCTTNSPFGSGDWTLWVCDYAPPGNFTGQKPY